MKPNVKTKLPGPKSNYYLKKLKKLNLGFSGPYPFVHSRKGKGCYFQDIDNNIFLDFATQIATNPLGYNNKELIKVTNKFSKQHPVKYAGQDFVIKKHPELIEELLKITNKNLNSAFLINSGAEAVENCIKLALRKQKEAKFGISFQGAFHGRCYDEETEILTENGWKFFKDLEQNENVATLNLNNMGLEYQKPLAIVSYKYKGDMIKIKNFSMDMLVTPNHRMLVIDRDNNLTFCEAKDLNSNLKIPRVANWKGIEKKYFTLPGIEINIPLPNGMIYTKKIKQKQIPMNQWLKFFGFWLAEGWTSETPKVNYSVGLAQKGSKECKEVEEMLNEIKFKYSKDIRKKGTQYKILEKKQLWSYLQQFGKSKEKFIPEEIKKLCPRQLKILFEWMCKGDGTVDGSNRIIYFTNSKKLADDVQEIFLKIGSNARIYWRKRKTCYSPSGNSIFYEVRQRKRKYHVFQYRNWPISRTQYMGKVYCCEVPNNVIYVRRNGYPLWGGNSLGALSATNSKVIQKENFLSIPMKTLPYNESAIENLYKILKNTSSKKEIGFIIIEALQGEGGYNVAPIKLMKDLRKFTKDNNIPLICDEVQSGIGRTGKWWAYEHYGIVPDLQSSAKALQVGATIANIKYRPAPGSISSTWGGGHLIDMALGIETIKIIKNKNLLSNINQQGCYIIKSLNSLKGIENIRGRGLMLAFDLKNSKQRDNFVVECLKQGLVLLGCGERGVRLIPPYIVSKTEINQALEIIENSIKKVTKLKFKHKGNICNYLSCPQTHS